MSKTLFVAALTIAAAFGQSSGSSGFTPGNLVATRTVYTGDATVLAAGQALPRYVPRLGPVNRSRVIAALIRPAALTMSGITTRLTEASESRRRFFWIKLTPAGTLENKLAIPTNLATTSFSSKSELAINLSTDGAALTFMGWARTARFR